MKKNMQLNIGSTVMLKNGEKVGTLSKIVVNPDEHDITHVVIDRGLIFSDEKILNVDRIETAVEDTIVIDSNLDERPDFEQEHYVPVRENWYDTGTSNSNTSPLYHFPPVGPSAYAHYPRQYNMMVKKTIRNTPYQSSVIDDSTQVTSLNGNHLGYVEKTFADDDGNISHIVISKGFFFPTSKLVPIHWVKRLGEKELRLLASEETVNELPEFFGEAAV